MVLRDFLSDVVAWWRWELAGMAGRPRSRDHRRACVLRIGSGRLVVERAGETRKICITDCPGEDVDRALREALPRRPLRRPRVDVIIESDRVLWRDLAPFRLPQSRAEKMARIDFQSETPFSAEDYAILMPCYRRGDRASRYGIVRARDLAPLLRIGRRAHVAELGVAETGGVRWLTGRSTRALVAGPVPGPRALGRAALLASALAGLAVAGAYQWRLTEAGRSLETEIAALERRVAELRAARTDVSADHARQTEAFLQKAEATPLSAVLEELAASLPDGTWLTSVEFSGTDISISGLSADAAALVPALDAAPSLRDPIFTEAVVPTESGNRFTLTIGTEGGGGG